MIYEQNGIVKSRANIALTDSVLYSMSMWPFNENQADIKRVHNKLTWTNDITYYSN